MSHYDSDSGLSVSVDGSHCGVSSLLKIEVKIPDLELKKTISISSTETIGVLKKQLINSLSTDLKDTMNFGLFIPPTAGKAGKFLIEERTLTEYGLYHDNCAIELRYKRRLYRTANINVARLKKLHSKANLKAFMECVGAGDVNKVLKTLNKGLDPNYQLKDTGETPLIKACSLNKPVDIIKALVEGGAHLDFRHSNGHTPIHAAAILGNLEAVKILLDMGQSPNTVDLEGLTPLYHCTISNTGVACAERLLFDYSVIGIEDENGLQEIHQACRFGRVQHLELLLQYNAEINSQTSKNGNTPLHICAYLNQESCARLLLFRGADRSITNRSGHTPYHQALLSDNKSLAMLIQYYKDEDVVIMKHSAKYNDKRKCSIPTMTRSRSAGGLSDTSQPDMPEDIDITSQEYFAGQPRNRTRSIGRLSEGPINGDSTSLFCNKRFSRSFNNLSLKMHLNSESLPIEPDQSSNCWAPEWDEEDNTDAISSVSGPSQRKSARNKTKKDSEKSRSHSAKRRNSRGDLSGLGDIDTRFLPRMVVLQRNSQGFGFVIRGLKASSGFAFVPTLRNPALQYFEEVEPGSVAARAGILKGDYILEINNQSVVFASHEETVRLIKASGDILAIKVVSVKKTSSKKPQRNNWDLDTSSIDDVSDVSSIMSSEVQSVHQLSTFTRTLSRPSTTSSAIPNQFSTITGSSSVAYSSTPHYKRECPSKPSIPLTESVNSLTTRVQRNNVVPTIRPESISSLDSFFPMPPPPGNDFCPKEGKIEEECLDDQTLRRISRTSNHSGRLVLHNNSDDHAEPAPIMPPPRNSAQLSYIAPTSVSYVAPPQPSSAPPPPPCPAPPPPCKPPPQSSILTPKPILKPILKSQQTLPNPISGFDNHLRDAIAKRRQKIDTDQSSVASFDSGDEASRMHIRTTLNALKQNSQYSRSQSNRWVNPSSVNPEEGTLTQEGMFQRTHSDVFSTNANKISRNSEDNNSRLYLV